MCERADTASTLQTFKAVADNAFTRSILRALSKNCAKDRGNRLEVALELYVGTRKDACASCIVSQVILSPILKLACRGFGITEEELKARFHDVYWRRALVGARAKDKLRGNCGSCGFRYTCGGCRARVYSYFRDVLAPDPGCVLNKDAWQEIRTDVKARERTGSRS